MCSWLYPECLQGPASVGVFVFRPLRHDARVHAHPYTRHARSMYKVRAVRV